jgi:hypothetical protein
VVFNPSMSPFAATVFHLQFFCCSCCAAAINVMARRAIVPEQSTSLEVTLAPGEVANFAVSRPQCKAAVNVVLGAHNGSLIKAMLLRNNTVLYVLVDTVNEETLGAINTALATKGTVTRVDAVRHRQTVEGDRAIATTKAAQGEQVLGARQAEGTISNLIAMAGVGGSSRKRRKMAQQGMAVLHSGQNWAAQGNLDMKRAEEKEAESDAEG